MRDLIAGRIDQACCGNVEARLAPGQDALRRRIDARDFDRRVQTRTALQGAAKQTGRKADRIGFGATERPDGERTIDSIVPPQDVAFDQFRRQPDPPPRLGLLGQMVRIGAIAEQIKDAARPPPA